MPDGDPPPSPPPPPPPPPPPTSPPLLRPWQQQPLRRHCSWFLVLHGDSRLPPSYLDHIEEALRRAGGAVEGGRQWRPGQLASEQHTICRLSPMMMSSLPVWGCFKTIRTEVGFLPHLTFFHTPRSPTHPCPCHSCHESPLVKHLLTARIHTLHTSQCCTPHTQFHVFINSRVTASSQVLSGQQFEHLG